MDLRNNLYWGAKYGLKSYFKNYTDWTLISSSDNVSETILERIIFSRQLPGGSKVYLIADAYRGDKMKDCLKDYLQTLAGKKPESILLQEENIGLHSSADLNIFNGHNGLMDLYIDKIKSIDHVQREAMVIGCYSRDFFEEYLLASKTYPLLMTTHLMAPEAYVMEAVLDSWLRLESGEEIQRNAGIAYNKFQKCGLNGATRLFCTGWKL